MTHPLTNHDIVRLRHQERVALGHAAMHSLEVREAGSTKSKPGEQRGGSWLDRLLRREAATPRTPARTVNQLSVIDSGPCRRARQTLSVVLDGEASATEVAETARHLPECEHCARFAAVVAELKLYFRAARLSGLKR